MGVLGHLTCLLRNLYAGHRRQKATVKTGHGRTDWFQIGKGVGQGCILSPYLFNFYAAYIMQNAKLDEAQARIKIAGRNTNNLRCLLKFLCLKLSFLTEDSEKLCPPVPQRLCQWQALVYEK